LTPKKAEQIFLALSKSIPEPRSDLIFENNFQLLVAVTLSAQSTDKAVNKVTPALFESAPNPEKMYGLGVEKISSLIKTLGLFNAKANYLFQTSKILIQKHNSKIPSLRRDLESLPGVGRKTAGVILNIAFNQPEIPVDTHIFRLSNRLGLVKAKTTAQTEYQLLEIVPAWALKKAHHLLILHGRYVCKAKNWLCGSCCIYRFCEFPDKLRR